MEAGYVYKPNANHGRTSVNAILVWDLNVNNYYGNNHNLAFSNGMTGGWVQIVSFIILIENYRE